MEDFAKKTVGRRSGSSRTAAGAAGSPRETAFEPRREPLPQDVAKRWIREHPDASLVAAFAIGVFIGSWMRG